jgi:myo-inositol 2-dehydrogenase/D-chiro-inositol 1-dehydrogenase
VTGLGIVGCGWVTANRHLPALARVRELEVVALGDADADALKTLAGRFGVRGRYGDVAQLLGDPRVDAIAVCVPPAAHVEVALAALAAGKHVFVEKPLALTLEDADRLVQHAAGTGLTTMVGFNLRFHRLVRRLRGLVSSGELGTIHAVGTTYTDDVLLRPDHPDWRESRQLGGGTLLEKAIHHFDLWRFLLADEVAEVHAHTSSEPAEIVGSVSARMRAGVLASTLAVDATSISNLVAVYGTKGRAVLDLHRFDGLEQASPSEPSGAVGTRARAALRTARTLPAGLVAARRGGEALLAYEAEWRHFAESIARGGGGVESTLEDGKRALDIALAARESAATGARVSVHSR